MDRLDPYVLDGNLFGGGALYGQMVISKAT